MVNPIDFGGHSSKVKVMMGIIDKCGVHGDATLCIVIFFFVPPVHRGYILFLCPRHKMAGAYSVTPFRHSGFSFRSFSLSYFEIFE